MRRASGLARALAKLRGPVPCSCVAFASAPLRATSKRTACTSFFAAAKYLLEQIKRESIVNNRTAFTIKLQGKIIHRSQTIDLPTSAETVHGGGHVQEWICNVIRRSVSRSRVEKPRFNRLSPQDRLYQPRPQSHRLGDGCGLWERASLSFQRTRTLTIGANYHSALLWGTCNIVI